MAGVSLGRIGEVTAEPLVRVTDGKRELAALALDEIRAAWVGRGEGHAMSAAAAARLRHHRVRHQRGRRARARIRSAPARERSRVHVPDLIDQSRHALRRTASSPSRAAFPSATTWARARYSPRSSAASWAPRCPRSSGAAGWCIGDLQRLPGARQDGRPPRTGRPRHAGGLAHPQLIREVRRPLGQGAVRAVEPLRVDARACRTWTCRSATARASFVAGSPEADSRRSDPGARCAARMSRAAGGEPSAIPDDPNGSDGHVAGICDPTGRVFGLMPHPEAFLHPENHPEWTSRGRRGRGRGSDCSSTGCAPPPAASPLAPVLSALTRAGRFLYYTWCPGGRSSVG